MNQEQSDKWYKTLKELIMLEYNLSDEDASMLLEVTSEYNLHNLSDFFNFVNEDINLINIWDRKHNTEDNSKILYKFCNKIEVD